jgi:hypothetical protein
MKTVCLVNLLISVLITGCGQENPTEIALDSRLGALQHQLKVLKNNPTVAGTPPAPAVSSKDLVRKKFNEIFECVQSIYPSVKDSQYDYLKELKDPQKGPSCNEKYLSGTIDSLSDGDIVKCNIALNGIDVLAITMPDLHKSFKQFGEEVWNLEPTMARASQYYNQKLYAIDDCAEGKKLHPVLLFSFDRMKKLYDETAIQIERYGKGALEECLRAGTADSKKTRMLHQWILLIQQGQAAVDLFRKEKEKKSPDANALKAKVSGITEVINQLYEPETLRKLKPTNSAYHIEGPPDSDPRLARQAKMEADAIEFQTRNMKIVTDEFIIACTEFLSSNAGKSLSQQARFFVGHGQNPARFEGTFEYVVEKFNRIIDDYNRYGSCMRILPCTYDRCP